MWVYEIGTSPYFSNVAEGEVTDLPEEPTPPPLSYEEAADARRPEYTGQQAVYPPDVGQIELHQVQYQPLQPDNPEVVVVDDTDINVDGEFIAVYIVGMCDLTVWLLVVLLPCSASDVWTKGVGDQTNTLVTSVIHSSSVMLLPFFSFSMFPVFSYNLGSCANNRNKCSQFADCKDYPGGYCCHCRPGFYGSGKQCVAEGTLLNFVFKKLL